MTQTVGSRSSFFRALARKNTATTTSATTTATTTATTADTSNVAKTPTLSLKTRKNTEMKKMFQYVEAEPVQVRTMPLYERVVREMMNIAYGTARVISRLVKAYLLWVLIYSVMEHIVPGLPKEISANLTSVWRAICPLDLPADANLLWQGAFSVLKGLENIWHSVASFLPFLG